MSTTPACTRQPQYRAFFLVLACPDLLLHITSFQSGLSWRQWRDAAHAARVGHLEMLYSSPYLTYNWEGALPSAAAAGRDEVVRWLLAKGQVGDSLERAVENAAANGHLGCLQQLLQYGARSPRATDLAAAKGHVEALVMLHTFGVRSCSGLALEAAAAYNHAEVLGVLLQRYSLNFKAEDFQRAYEWAVWNQHTDVLRLLQPPTT